MLWTRKSETMQRHTPDLAYSRRHPRASSLSPLSALVGAALAGVGGLSTGACGTCHVGGEGRLGGGVTG